MKIKKGKLIVLEGTDGSGKGEQFGRLVKRLKDQGLSVGTFDFPQYGQPSAFFIEQYLNGKYGGWKEVGPYKASVFYALDRFDVGLQISQAIKEGKICVFNRYVGSNMGHQGTKIANGKKLKEYWKWVQHFEYEIMGIPRPDISIILYMSADIARKLVGKKDLREYLAGKKRDIHEEDIVHLDKAGKMYLKMAKLFPKDFKVIKCFKEGSPLARQEIHEKIYAEVKKYLK